MGGAPRWEDSASRKCTVGEQEVETHWAKLLDSAHDTKREPFGSYDGCLLRGLFSAAEVQRLVEASEGFGYGTTHYPPQYRGNLRLISMDRGLAEALWARVRPHVPQELQMEGRTWDPVGLNECWRLAKYSPGDQFDKHCDTSFWREGPGGAEEQSMYTVNVYLSGGHDGGCTRFYESREGDVTVAVPPEPGVAVLFRQPPGANYLHDGEQLRSGIKYLLRTDVMYRQRPAAPAEATAAEATAAEATAAADA
eukprot:TRINITY_DN4503_c0_g1_i1.p2 TRINITY_DN4503_c0_g1~~TRINITY_DN4503_c0_g1_i1.p2  ORF type:complete len:279 (+),score=88.96 TRINITY_DN4503_c0_g1_i1:84-839(+)